MIQVVTWTEHIVTHWRKDDAILAGERQVYETESVEGALVESDEEIQDDTINSEDSMSSDKDFIDPPRGQLIK